MYWQTSHFRIELNKPKVMGIVNVTPDSFSDGGSYVKVKDALKHSERLLQEGADILDFGGESTRPGALPLSFEEEKSRLVPVVKEAVRLGVPISVDTYKPELMQVMLDLGVDIINDIWSLRWRSAPDGLDGRQVIALNSGCGLCVMHMHREPYTMQLEPMGGDVISQVLLFLEHTIQDLKRLGIDLTRIVIDPGIGFGKTVTQNFALLKYQREFLMLGQPLLCGWSRKSSLAAVLGDISQHPLQASAHPRMIPSVAAALLAVERGASIVRVHDVLQTVQALKVLDAINSSSH